MFREKLLKIIDKNDLSETEIHDMMTEIFSGKITDAQTGAFMAALATKGETFTELAGAAMAMRKKAVRINVSDSKVVDTCGTGGDNAQTFNISTTAAFVIAGCSVTVAKHGNRSVSSRCGSADLLETLGVNIDTDPEIVEEAIKEIGIGFLFAPLYHSALRYAANARKELGIRSIFNMLGPLTNPAAANCQVLGVYAPDLTEMFAQALKRLGVKNAFVVHGHDGLDEISICAPTRISELNNDSIRTYDIFPELFFDKPADPKALIGGNAKENADITLQILNGAKGPKRDIVLINSAAALVAVGKAKDFHEGILLAKQSIDSKNALKKLNEIIHFTQENG